MSQLKGDLQDGTFLNPIRSGDYADPSVLRSGDDYYMTHSSFTFAPGLLIWHSKDLVNWRPVTKALKQYLGDVWAPEFIEYKGTFYIYAPINYRIMVLTAPSPHGPWSEPVDIGLHAIDPGHVVDNEGNRYLHTGGGYMTPLTPDGLSIQGETKKVYDGWAFPEEWIVEGSHLESPKLTFHNGYYYLTSAQGGTSGPATSHMVVSARSKTPWGPFENSPYNPIVRTRSRQERWCSKGHATLVDTPEGNWWMMYHAYEKDYYTLGRQTLLEPVVWTEDGWFHIPEQIETDKPINKPTGSEIPNGFDLSDDFSDPELGLQWSFYKKAESRNYRIGDHKLVLETASQPSPLVCMPEHHAYEVSVKIKIEPGSQGRLLLFYNDSNYIGIGISDEGVYGIIKGWQYPAVPYSGNTIFVRMRNDHHEVVCYYSTDQQVWTKLQHSFETSGWHHNVLGEFLALRIGLDAVGKGLVSFENFKYKEIL